MVEKQLCCDKQETGTLVCKHTVGYSFLLQFSISQGDLKCSICLWSIQGRPFYNLVFMPSPNSFLWNFLKKDRIFNLLDSVKDLQQPHSGILNLNLPTFIHSIWDELCNCIHLFTILCTIINSDELGFSVVYDTGIIFLQMYLDHSPPPPYLPIQAGK